MEKKTFQVVGYMVLGALAFEAGKWAYNKFLKKADPTDPTKRYDASL